MVYGIIFNYIRLFEKLNHRFRGCTFGTIHPIPKVAYFISVLHSDEWQFIQLQTFTKLIA